MCRIVAGILTRARSRAFTRARARDQRWRTGASAVRTAPARDAAESGRDASQLDCDIGRALFVPRPIQPPCTHSRAPARPPARRHALTHLLTHPRTHTRTHARIFARSLACNPACTHTREVFGMQMHRAFMSTRMRAPKHVCAHTHARTHVCMRTRKHTRTRMHVHARCRFDTLVRNAGVALASHLELVLTVTRAHARSTAARTAPRCAAPHRTTPHHRPPARLHARTHARIHARARRTRARTHAHVCTGDGAVDTDGPSSRDQARAAGAAAGHALLPDGAGARAARMGDAHGSEILRLRCFASTASQACPPAHTPHPPATICLQNIHARTHARMHACTHARSSRRLLKPHAGTLFRHIFTHACAHAYAHLCTPMHMSVHMSMRRSLCC